MAIVRVDDGEVELERVEEPANAIVAVADTRTVLYADLNLRMDLAEARAHFFAWLLKDRRSPKWLVAVPYDRDGVFNIKLSTEDIKRSYADLCTELVERMQAYSEDRGLPIRFRVATSRYKDYVTMSQAWLPFRVYGELIFYPRAVEQRTPCWWEK